MAATFPAPNLQRLREAMKPRSSETFADYGVDEPYEQVVDRIEDLMYEIYPGYYIDHLLVRPREALRLCDAVRHRFQCYDLPDHLILQAARNRHLKG
jgi:hypothetical protein